MRRRAFCALVAGSGLAVAVAPARVFAGACAPASFRPTYVSAADVSIGRGGAVLVGLTMSMGGGPGPDDPLAGRYTLTQGQTSIPLQVERAGPGLLRLLPARFTPGRYTVRGPAGDLAVRLVNQDAHVPAACVIASLAVHRNEGSQMPYSPATWGVAAQFATPLDAAAIGLIVLPRAPHTDTMLFADTQGAARGAQLYSSPGRCSRNVPGQSPPSSGTVIRIAVVGTNGAISAPSNEMTVTG